MNRIRFKTLSSTEKAHLIRLATQSIIAVGRDNAHIPEQNMATEPFTPIEIDHDLGRYYLDGDDSVLCPMCAEDSNVETEVPHFRPKSAEVNQDDPELTCDHCSMTIEPVELPHHYD